MPPSSWPIWLYWTYILNLPQNVASFINSLPRPPATLDVIIVRTEGVNESNRDFRVRRAVVLRALQWLIANNRYYNDVTIDSNTLEMLPIDGQLTNLSSVSVSSELSSENDDHDPHLQSTFVHTSAQTRQRMVTIASYFKHLMLYHDQHFATHPQFR